MDLLLRLITFMVFLLLIQPTVQQGCIIDINRHVSDPSPLIINPETRNFIRTADTRGNIRLTPNQPLLLACPGFNNFLTVRGAGAHERTATCVSGQTFRVDNINYNFNQLVCVNWPVSVQRTSGICLQSRTLVVIGFDVSIAFIPVMQLCHDTRLHHTHYTEFTLLRDAAGFQRATPRPDWQQGQFFAGVNADNLYRRVIQRTTVSILLNSFPLGEQLVSLTNDFFMSRGHLTARSDYTFATQQAATFWFTNASPQWQTFNGGNWNSLENDVRSFAGRTNQDLTVYTGTWGSGSLADVNQRQVNIFLSINGTTNQMPMPRFFYKVVRNPITNVAVAFIGLNNPYVTLQQARDSVFCTDICNSISWLTWNQFNLVNGYSFCCEVNDFRRTVNELPAFTTVGILR